jgi:hypothetical protein
MEFGGIRAGDVLVCCSCDRERIAEQVWIDEIGRRYFPDRKPAQIYDSDLRRFLCSSCKAKSLLKRHGQRSQKKE